MTLRVKAPFIMIRTSPSGFRHLYKGAVIERDELGDPAGYDQGEVKRLLDEGYLEEITP